MFVDSTSAPRATVAENMRVYILNIGFMECDANNVVAGTVVGTKSMPTPVTKWIKIPSYAVLIFGRPSARRCVHSSSVAFAF
ncbi:MAG: hypothetical protein ABSH25_04745 [Syntrophorhabdales bacterium]